VSGGLALSDYESLSNSARRQELAAADDLDVACWASRAAPTAGRTSPFISIEFCQLDGSLKVVETT
jgi:hypothetical protein